MDNDKSLSKPVPAAIVQAKELASQIQLVSGNQLSDDDAMLLGSMFTSGYFSSVDSLSKAVTRAVFGKRIGVDVMTAISSLYIIDGKPALEAQAIRNTCVMAGYDIITKHLDENECVLEWHYKGKFLGESKFSKVDAQRMGFIDPTCTEWPNKHNIRQISRWNKYKKTKELIQDCECKDNWKKVPLPMLLARATTLGSRMYGNHALRQEVYDVDELRDSNIRPDTTPVDIARIRVEDAKSIDDLQKLTKELTTDELQEVLPEINAKTKELLNNAKA